MNWIKKIIPAYIEIRSLYWVAREKQMDKELSDIFQKIDQDKYEEAKKLIIIFENTYSQNGVPNFIGEKYAEIYRAKSMIH
jgi:hypothetical protein